MEQHFNAQNGPKTVKTPERDNEYLARMVTFNVRGKVMYKPFVAKHDTV